MRIFPLGARPDVSPPYGCVFAFVWRPVSSRKLHAGTSRGEDEGRARETRRCLTTLARRGSALGGNGAVNEKSEVGGFASNLGWAEVIDIVGDYGRY